MEELKPCPFCGCNAKVSGDFPACEVYCTNCGAGIERDYRSEAIEAWNGRPSMSKIGFYLWLTSHLALILAFFWWCLDCKMAMLANICLAIGFAIAALIHTERGS